MIVKVTVPDGATGVTELALTVAVNVTEVPMATEFEGDAVNERFAGRAVVV